MFSWLQPPSLAEKIGSLALLPFVTYVAANAFFSSLPMFPAMPAWLFDAVRVVLSAGVIIPLAGAGRLLFRRRSTLSGRAWIGLGVLLAGVILNALMLFQISGAGPFG